MLMIVHFCALFPLAEIINELMIFIYIYIYICNVKSLPVFMIVVINLKKDFLQNFDIIILLKPTGYVHQQV